MTQEQEVYQEQRKQPFAAGRSWPAAGVAAI